MTKAEKQEAQKAVNFAKINPRYAAATLAGVMRSASRKSLIELIDIANSTGLRELMIVENGTYVVIGGQ